MLQLFGLDSKEDGDDHSFQLHAFATGGSYDRDRGWTRHNASRPWLAFVYVTDFQANILSRSGLVVKFVLAMHEPRVRFTAATLFCLVDTIKIVLLPQHLVKANWLATRWVRFWSQSLTSLRARSSVGIQPMESTRFTAGQWSLVGYCVIVMIS